MCLDKYREAERCRAATEPKHTLIRCRETGKEFFSMNEIIGHFGLFKNVQFESMRLLEIERRRLILTLHDPNKWELVQLRPWEHYELRYIENKLKQKVCLAPWGKVKKKDTLRRIYELLSPIDLSRLDQAKRMIVEYANV